jgi:thioesterase domain-containing protein/acyl carrier protein
MSQPVTAELGLSQDADLNMIGNGHGSRVAAELRLALMWQQVLGKDKIGASDDFFELGGDSLAATVLATEIEATFGIPFSFADIMNFSTVAKQALAISEDRSVPTLRLPPHCILVRAGGLQSPVFIVHGAWGFSFFRRAFIDEVGHNRSVYLFQYPGLDGRSCPLGTVEELAKLYAATMQAIQPCGPYYIVALCAGSFIALELCNILEKAKLKIARLILIDPHPEPHPEQDFLVTNVDNHRSIIVRLKASFNSRFRRIVGSLVEGQKRFTPEQQLALFQDRIRRRRELNADWIEDNAVPEAMWKAVAQLRRALSTCMPEPYRGRAAMLLAPRKQAKILSTGSFWRTHLDGFEYQLCHCDHRALFGSHLADTARFVRNALEMPLDPRLLPGAMVGSV